MSGALLTKYVKDLYLSSYVEAIYNESTNLRVQAWDIPHHRWEISLETIEIEDRAEQRKMFMFLQSLGKLTKSFAWRIPIHSEPTGRADGVPEVNGDHIAGSLAISISSSLVNLSPGFLNTGDMFKFSNHNKVYMVEDYTGTITSGTISLNTPLVKPVTDATTVFIRNVEMQLKQKPDTELTKYGLRAGDRYSEAFEIELIEDL